MPTPKIITFEEDDTVACPICGAIAIGDDGLVQQPSCEHILFVFANGEVFEYPETMQDRLDAALETADEAGDYFDHWEWLSAQCDEGDGILEQVTDDVGCGSLRFRVWIGIRETPRDSRSRCRPVGFPSDEEYSAHDQGKYFQPTAKFNRWVTAEFSSKLIYDVGAGVGHVSKALSEAGLKVTAIDLQPRTESEFDVIKADSTEYAFEKGSVLMLCRPCHDHDFVRNTILRGLTCGVRAVVYVGLQRNVRADLGGYFRQFTQRRISGIGHADEHIWEMKISRAQADACMRRGAIPPLSSDFSS